jgi:hypothetical protein
MPIPGLVSGLKAKSEEEGGCVVCIFYPAKLARKYKLAKNSTRIIKNSNKKQQG